MVAPPPSSAPSWAQVSTPRARPLTTQTFFAGKRRGELAGGAFAVARGPARADDGEHALRVQRRFAAHIQRWRRIVYFVQSLRIARGDAGHGAHARALHLGKEAEKVSLRARRAQSFECFRPQKGHVSVADIIPYAARVAVLTEQAVKAFRSDAVHTGKPDPVLLHDAVFHAYPQYLRSSVRYCTASETCSSPMTSSSARSAMVRATLRMRV